MFLRGLLLRKLLKKQEVFKGANTAVNAVSKVVIRGPSTEHA